MLDNVQSQSEKQNVNTKYSKNTFDSEGNALTEQQQEYFKDSKVRDDEGNLQVVYHGTTADFTVFDREFGNSEGDWGKGFYFTNNYGDVSENYANEEGRDLSNKIELYAERLESEGMEYDEALEKAKNRWITSAHHTIEAYLNIKNPLMIMPNDSGTYLDFNEGYDYEIEEYTDEPSGLLYDFIEALTDIANNYAYRPIDFSFLDEYGYDGGAYAADIVKTIKEKTDYIDEFYDDDGYSMLNEIIRQAFEKIGFDGIIDKTVGYKFSNMPKMTKDTTHYIVFESNQAKNINNIAPTSNLDIRYSKNTEFGKEIEKWYKDGRANGKTFIIGNTSDVLQGLGAIDNQIYFYSDKINNILKKHNDTMSLDVIKRVPDIIDNPALIMSSHSRSQENNTRLLMFGNIKNQDGKPIMCVLDLQPYENGMIISDMQKLTSAYPLTNEQININDYLSKSDVLYITKNKKIATKLVRQIGFHQNGVPIAFQQSGYIGNITYNNRSVNIIGKPFFDVVKVDNDKQSRNTRLTLDDNIEDVNEAFLSAVKVLQNVHIDDIDLSSEVVNKAEKAAKHIQDEVKKSGYRTQKMTGKGSVRTLH